MKEQRAELQAPRIATAIASLEGVGKRIVYQDHTKIQFFHKEQIVTFFPYTGWHTGKSITDGRGLKNLLKQLYE